MIFIAMMCHMNLSFASQSNEESSLIKIRTGKHAGFIRIVLEGPEKIILQGKVEKRGNNVQIIFPEIPFSIEEKKLPLQYRVDRNKIELSSGRSGKMKVFTMKNPGRLIIDLYRKRNIAKPKKGKNKTESNNSTVNIAEKNKTGKAKVSIATVKSAVKDKSPSPLLKKQKNITTPLVNVGKETYSDKRKDDYGFITREYKKTWELLQSGSAYRVIKELNRIQPEKEETIAMHHFIYGMAYSAIEDYLSAIKHFRLTYIFTKDKSLKELAYLKRAEAYLQQKLYYEAKINYTVFLEEFPSSKYEQKAHNNLAKTLSQIGFYHEAAEHFKMAGESPEVLFSYANSLQRTKRLNDAKKAYARAILADKDYPAKSPETYFLIGENMRMTGDSENAKKHLISIEKGSFQFEARLSLGLIALEENDVDEAIENLQEASISSERKIKIRALYYLAEALSLKGKPKEAIKNLEIIRKKYLNSSLYKVTLLELARLYKRVGNMKVSISLLKELVYGKHPPEEAFSELEKILIEAGRKYSSSEGGDSEFLELWNEVGLWMFDESREDFLLNIAEQLKHEGKPFLQLCSWLVKNGSTVARVKSALHIAEYNIDSGNIEKAQTYLEIAEMNSPFKSDSFFRVEARVHYKSGRYGPAILSIKNIKKGKDSDLLLLGRIISDSGEIEASYINNAVGYFESMLAESVWSAEVYIALADIIFKQGDSKRALKYYRMALKKQSDDEWTIYRIGRIVNRPESIDMFSKIQKNDTLISRAARTKIMELSLMERVEAVY
jgi:tetratricopeptide (TPR) repeat protein